MTTNSVNNYHHQSSHYRKQKFKRKISQMRQSREIADGGFKADRGVVGKNSEVSKFEAEFLKENQVAGGNQSDRGVVVDFEVKEFELLGSRVEMFVRALKSELENNKEHLEWKRYLQKFENFTEILIDWSAESENLIKSKQKVLERKLLRKCNSISNSDSHTSPLTETPAQIIIQSTQKASLHLEEIQSKIKKTSYLAKELSPLFARSRRVITLLLTDMERLVSEKMIQSQNKGLVMWNLIKMAAGQELASLEERIRSVMKSSFLRHLVNDSGVIFQTLDQTKQALRRNSQLEGNLNLRGEKGFQRESSGLASNGQFRKNNLIANRTSDYDEKERSESLQKVKTSKTQKKLPKFDEFQKDDLETKNRPSIIHISPTNPNSNIELNPVPSPKKRSSPIRNQNLRPNQTPKPNQKSTQNQKLDKKFDSKKILNKKSEILNPQDILEIGGLQELLHKSKKDFLKFLKSFGWTDHQIGEVMRTISLRESAKIAHVQSSRGSLPRLLTNDFEELRDKEEEQRFRFKKKNFPDLKEDCSAKNIRVDGRFQNQNLIKNNFLRSDEIQDFQNVNQNLPKNQLSKNKNAIEKICLNLKNQFRVPSKKSAKLAVSENSKSNHVKNKRKTWSSSEKQIFGVKNQTETNYKSKSFNQKTKNKKQKSFPSHKNELYNRDNSSLSLLSEKNQPKKNKSKNFEKPECEELETQNRYHKSNFLKQKKDSKKNLKDEKEKNIHGKANNSGQNGFDKTSESRFQQESRQEDESESGNLSKTACKLIRNQISTRDVQIKEYVSQEERDVRVPFPNADFHSQKTNCANFSSDSLHLPGPDTSSIRPAEESKLDLKKMSLSNNLSQIFRERKSEINIYAELSTQQREISRLSHKSINSVRNEVIPLLPVSDPEFSSQKLKKNQKMRDFLERANQNLSNKSILSLTDNRELFSRKSSSLQDLMIERRKKQGHVVNSIISNQLDRRKKNSKQNILINQAERRSKTENSQGCLLNANSKISSIKKSTFSPPRTYQFADVLDDKNVLNLDLLEYPDISANRVPSFQSSKLSREALVHRQKLMNTRMVSFTSRGRRSYNSNGTRSPSASPERVTTQASRTDHQVLKDIQRVSGARKQQQISDFPAGDKDKEVGTTNDIRIPVYDAHRQDFESQFSDFPGLNQKNSNFEDGRNRKSKFAETGGHYYKKKEKNCFYNDRKFSDQSRDLVGKNFLGGKREKKVAKQNSKLTKIKKFEQFEEICKKIEEKLFEEILQEKRDETKKRDLKNSLLKKEREKVNLRFESLARKFEESANNFLVNHRFGLKIFPDQIEAFFNGFTEFLCARRLDEVVFNINKEYGPNENQILLECRNPEGVDVSTYRECKTQPVLSEDSFFEFFYYRHSLNLLGEHPFREIQTPKSLNQAPVTPPQIGKIAPRPRRLQAVPSIENFESNQRSEANSDLIVSSENVQTLENFVKRSKCPDNWQLVLEWLGFNPERSRERDELSETARGDNLFSSLQPIRCSLDTLTKQAQIQLENLYYTFLAEKMLFDSLNEALCSWRPFATKGRPLPGLSHFGRLNRVKIQPNEIPYIFSVTVSKQMESASLLCGVLQEREALLQRRWNFGGLCQAERRLLECLLASDEGLGNNLLGPGELANKLREEKLVKFLNWGIFETDEKWLFYDYEKLETELKLSRMVCEALFEDLVVDFLN